MIPNHLLLYPSQIKASFSPHQRSYMQEIVISTEILQPDNAERVRDFAMLRHKWDAFISPSLKGSGIYAEKAGRNQEPGETNDAKV